MAATTTAEVGHQDHQGLGMMGFCGGCVLFDGEHLEKRWIFNEHHIYRMVMDDESSCF